MAERITALIGRHRPWVGCHPQSCSSPASAGNSPYHRVLEHQPATLVSRDVPFSPLGNPIDIPSCHEQEAEDPPYPRHRGHCGRGSSLGFARGCFGISLQVRLLRKRVWQLRATTHAVTVEAEWRNSEVS